MHNNPALNAKVKAALTGALGAANVFEDDAVMNSEDFDKAIPGPHTSRFKPVPEPSLRAGVKAMASVATALLQ